MSIEDVARPEAAEVNAGAYPDVFQIGSLSIPLSYLYDYGQPNDGVTAVIPLALLNQVPAAPFDWLVPGMLAEKVTELIRTLPKPIRTKLVPAPISPPKPCPRYQPVLPPHLS